MANAVQLKGTCFCIITGASQGIGRAIAVEIAPLVGPGSVLLLVARNQFGLEETKSLAAAPNVEILTKSMDLAKASSSEFDGWFSEISDKFDKNAFDTNIIIHNAGSIGDLARPADSLDSLVDWQDYYALNLFNVAVLNCAFLKFIGNADTRSIIVNITSLCGIQPFVGLSMYGSGKAARELYFKVLAAERPLLKVLNYSPGPVDTAMVESIIETAANASLKTNFIEYKNKNQLLRPEQTAKKFVNVLCDGKYTSGDHVDYFD